MDKKDIALRTTDFVLKQMGQFTAVIYNPRNPAQNEVEVASGIKIKSRRAYYVVSVAHFFVENSDFSIKYLDETNITRQSIRNLKTFGGGDNDVEDFAVIELDERTIGDKRHYVDVEQLYLCSGIRFEAPTYVMGYPGERVEINHDKKIIGFGLNCVSTAVSNRVPPNPKIPIDPTKDIVVEYSGSDQWWKLDGTRLSAPIRPHGFSGGGIWLDSNTNDGIYTTEKVKLAGLQVSYYPRQGLLRGILATHWAQYLA